jgi:Cu(I)/Ag(I) efflux system protein CusF
MMARLSRYLVAALMLIPLIACTNPPPTAAQEREGVPLGIDLGASRLVATDPKTRAAASVALGEGDTLHRQRGTQMEMALASHNDAHGTGTVNSIDPAQRKVNLSHNPIPEIGWPAMTMDLPVAPSVDLRGLKPGTRVNFTIEWGEGGMYEIRAIAPAGGGR